MYLPQFHPFIENDNWWGKGFTEWTNVTKAKPLFRGHNQPHLPADLGFYDLRLEEARIAQAKLAKDYGIYGFCYYHYWFSGVRLMNRPLDDMLKSKNPDFPFMLCWANETWSRRWLGEEKEILIKQEYNLEDDVKQINWLYDNVFCDSRYIKIYDRPAFLIYRPQDLPNYKKTIQQFNDIAEKKGLARPFIIGSNSHTGSLEGVDQIMNFEPQLNLLPEAFNDNTSFRKRLRNLKLKIISSKLKVYDYTKVKKLMASRIFDYKHFPCVFVGWDNTARRGKNGIIIHNQNKEIFKESLVNAVEVIKHNPSDEKIVFINAWNEWAEGNHLEPCRKFGHDFLNAIKEVFIGK